ncbi:MAG: hypothetical protein MSG64_07130 [Pyrinomonadaceae bacterium MAG19_C2-C3]|nr:hypothetical protein [Pyrinomonadaceae bacterium MAG19_C2-C3]
MFRGNYTARIDPKGRLKIPTVFRNILAKQYGSNFYITSLTGESALIYPLQEWQNIEGRLALLPAMDAHRRRFLDRANYYGQEATMDLQGRILIHPLLRRSSGIIGEVAVLGYLTYLDVWELERFQQRMHADPYTAEDEAALARLGI